MSLSRRQSLFTVAVAGLGLLISGPALAGKKPPKKRKGDLISGKAIDETSQEPVAGAMIEVYPVEPQSKKSDVTVYSDLIGVDTSNPTGAWSVEVLSSPAAFVEFGLLRGWSYEIVVTAPGYYQLREPFEFKKGSEVLTIALQPKVADVVDNTGVVGDDNTPKAMSRGQVMRGN